MVSKQWVSQSVSQFSSSQIICYEHRVSYFLNSCLCIRRQCSCLESVKAPVMPSASRPCRSPPTGPRIGLIQSAMDLALMLYIFPPPVPSSLTCIWHYVSHIKQGVCFRNRPSWTNILCGGWNTDPLIEITVPFWSCKQWRFPDWYVVLVTKSYKWNIFREYKIIILYVTNTLLWLFVNNVFRNLLFQRTRVVILWILWKQYGDVIIVS